jgi:hypothetical protein
MKKIVKIALIILGIAVWSNYELGRVEFPDEFEKTAAVKIGVLVFKFLTWTVLESR